MNKVEATIEKIVSVIEKSGEFIINDPDFLNHPYIKSYISNLLRNISGWIEKYRPDIKKNIVVFARDGLGVIIFEDKNPASHNAHYEN